MVFLNQTTPVEKQTQAQALERRWKVRREKLPDAQKASAFTLGFHSWIFSTQFQQCLFVEDLKLMTS